MLACDSSAPAALAAHAARARAAGAPPGEPRSAWSCAPASPWSWALPRSPTRWPLIEPLVVVAGALLVLFAITEIARVAAA